MWICVFYNVKMRVWWNGYVYLIMSGYGRDESSPTPDGVFATYFVDGRCIINNPFRMPSRNVRNVLVICVLHIRYAKRGFCVAKVWFLACKKGVFTLQKPPFWNARYQTKNTEQRNVVLYIRCIAIAFWCWIWWKQGAVALWFGVYLGF